MLAQLCSSRITMQQAIFEYYPTAEVVYRFTHRDKHRQFSRACIENFREWFMFFQLSHPVSLISYMQVSPMYSSHKTNAPGSKINASIQACVPRLGL
ncbi:hypothetical protein F4604DRAFT_1745065 [Suillus subluteus]|nr:hypothetical protein F4604DRAFT_1745065 [Suillus subluteus]